ncbi:MAG: ZIP family metal transporter [Planctomycetota bacterium]
MNHESLLVVYCIFIFFAANAGGRLSDLIHLTHLRTQLLMSGVAGLMMGVALLHLLPHAVEILGSPFKVGVGILIGLVAMFLLIRLFHTHDHETRSVSPACDSDHDHTHDHDHTPDHAVSLSATSSENEPKRFGWAGVFFGLTLHTLIDGVALASSVAADASHGSWMSLAGIGTFLVIVLHIPLDSFAIASVMERQGWPPNARRWATTLFSLACPIGAALLYVGSSGHLEDSTLLGWTLAISAGFFVCIALADLLPEVAFHDHDRFKLIFALLLGISIAVAVESLPGHNHGHDHGFAHEEAQHD